MLEVCVDKSLPLYLIPKAAELSIAENPQNASQPQQLTLITTKKWSNGRILKYSFLGGELAVHNNISIKLVKLEQFCNIKFVYEPVFSNADIRVTFVPGSSWSFIGTDCLAIPKDEATMNLGWLTKDTPLSMYRVVHHEFLHALGCVHEHQNPTNNIQWNKEYVYWYYATYHGWTKEKVDVNLFKVYDKTISQYSTFDPLSIMIYSIPKEMTLNGFSVGWNQYLSETDKSLLLSLYPKNTPPPALPPYSVYFDTIADVLDGNHQLNFSTINTEIPLPKGKYRLTIRALQ